MNTRRATLTQLYRKTWAGLREAIRHYYYEMIDNYHRPLLRQIEEEAEALDPQI